MTESTEMTRAEITSVRPEQYERWQEAAEADNRSFSSWARIVLDKAAEQQLQTEGA